MRSHRHGRDAPAFSLRAAASAVTAGLLPAGAWEHSLPDCQTTGKVLTIAVCILHCMLSSWQVPGGPASHCSV